MKKRNIARKLQLRKDTLLAITENGMAGVNGGTSGHPICDQWTEDAVCIATTISPDCVHNESVGCPTTFTPTW